MRRFDARFSSARSALQGERVQYRSEGAQSPPGRRFYNRTLWRDLLGPDMEVLGYLSLSHCPVKCGPPCKYFMIAGMEFEQGIPKGQFAYFGRAADVSVLCSRRKINISKSATSGQKRVAGNLADDWSGSDFMLSGR
jgi:hypothetical protein